MDQKHTLPVKQGHSVAYFEYGNPSGPAIISFHGGPGSRSKEKHASVFDLATYRVILFDQRGCGESAPTGDITHNTTQDIIADAERIRKKLGIQSWYVAGGSWGSTLALLYAQQFPARVNGLLLAAVFLADKDTTRWSLQDTQGAAQFVPDVLKVRQAFLDSYHTTPETAAKDLLGRLTSANEDEQRIITAGVMNWEGNLFSLTSEVSYTAPEDVDERRIADTKIFLHYEAHDWFIKNNQVIQNIGTIKHLPTIIVHGRYDILCPIKKAADVADSLDNAELVIAGGSGHSLSVEGNEIKRLAFDRFLKFQQAK
jgi:proline iminopeptidase